MPYWKLVESLRKNYKTWVERFSVHGSGLKRPNWLLAKGKQVDRYKCYVSPNGWKKLIWITPQSSWIKFRISADYNRWTWNPEPLTLGKNIRKGGIKQRKSLPSGLRQVSPDAHVRSAILVTVWKDFKSFVSQKLNSMAFLSRRLFIIFSRKKCVAAGSEACIIVSRMPNPLGATSN